MGHYTYQKKKTLLLIPGLIKIYYKIEMKLPTHEKYLYSRIRDVKNKSTKITIPHSVLHVYSTTPTIKRKLINL